MRESPTVRVGDEGRAATLMCPSGIVMLGGQRYSARCAQGAAESGEAVIVIRGDNSGLVILPARDVSDPRALPGYQTAVHASFGDAVKAKGRHREEAAQRWTAAREKWIHRIGPAIGLLSGLCAVWLNRQDWLGGDLTLNSGLTAVGVLLFAAFFGWSLLYHVDRYLRGIDFTLHRVSLLSTCLALAASVAAITWSIPRLGNTMGLFMGLLAGLLAGLPLPCLVLLISAEATGDLEGDMGGSPGDALISGADVGAEQGLGSQTD